MRDNQKIVLGHGSGGKLSHELIKDVFLHHFQNPILAQLGDSAIVELPGCTPDSTATPIKSPSLGGRGKGEGVTLTLPSPIKGEGGMNGGATIKVAFTTDSFVVKPLFFPGGDIGRLAISGTVNDLAVVGARPLFLSAAFILEEGLELRVLERVVESMKRTAEEAGVIISTGDTKVVERGAADGLYINTAGLGIVEDGLALSQGRIRPGDKVILSGTLGDHGIAILSSREELRLESHGESDCAPLADMLLGALRACPRICFMRDPTRGGLATTLNEVVNNQDFGILLYEGSLPIKEGVRSACEILGLDPLYLANEGKAVIVCPRQDAPKVLKLLRAHHLGRQAEIIGEVVEGPAGRAIMKTQVGGTRIIDMPLADQLPRIC